MIDAHECREVEIFEIAGECLQAKYPQPNNERVLMKLAGNFVEIMFEVNPERKTNTPYENRKKVFHLEVLQEVYGCVDSSLRSHEFFSLRL